MTAKRLCSFDRCDRPLSTRGLCATHYQQFRKGRPLTPIRPLVPRGALLADILEDRTIRVESGCWLWTRGKSSEGYGQVAYRGKTLYAHRASYEIHVGPIPAGLDIDHLCRTRACVNPAHMEPVTRSENFRRQAKALQTHCFRGHEFTTENTYRCKNGTRRCRQCGREYRRAKQAA